MPENMLQGLCVLKAVLPCSPPGVTSDRPIGQFPKIHSTLLE